MSVENLEPRAVLDVVGVLPMDPRADGRRIYPISRLLAKLRRVLDFIDQHLEGEITVAGLADLANLSAFHFTRMFTAAVGVPPYRYVSRRRLENAMAMLAVGKLPLCEIAHRSRFSSQASFNRAFRRATGMTPGEYRRITAEPRPQARSITQQARERRASAVARIFAQSESDIPNQADHSNDAHSNTGFTKSFP